MLAGKVSNVNNNISNHANNMYNNLGDFYPQNFLKCHCQQNF